MNKQIWSTLAGNILVIQLTKTADIYQPTLLENQKFITLNLGNEFLWNEIYPQIRQLVGIAALIFSCPLTQVTWHQTILHNVLQQKVKQLWWLLKGMNRRNADEFKLNNHVNDVTDVWNGYHHNPMWHMHCTHITYIM